MINLRTPFNLYNLKKCYKFTVMATSEIFEEGKNY